MKIEWSKPAASDLQAISEFIESDRNLETANRITRTIFETAQSLEKMPFRGRIGRIENTRELVVSQLPYLIVYQVQRQRLIILNILHGAQQWP